MNQQKLLPRMALMSLIVLIGLSLLGCKSNSEYHLTQKNQITSESGIRLYSLQADACMAFTGNDWMSPVDPLAQVVRPTDCNIVEQNPPDFRWPEVASTGSYQVSLTYPNGSIRTLSSSQNFINWDEVLPIGKYSWTVKNPAGVISSPRRFDIGANSVPFLVPSTNAVISTLNSKVRPRSLPDLSTLNSIKTQRQTAINELLVDMSGRLSSAVPAQGSSADDCFTYSKLALKALMACAFSNQDSYCNDAIRRVVNLASWDPNGATIYSASGMDMAARYLTMTISIGYDWLYPRLTSTQRSQILSAANLRNQIMYNDVIGTRSRLSVRPRDSHGNQTILVIAVNSMLLNGDLSEANTWLTGSLPLAMNSINPWGDEEGGFANSSTQGGWDVGELLPLWYLMKYASGIDISKKAWVRNWSKFLAYFTPPGMSSGSSVFGDGFELNELEHQARYGKGYTFFAPSPLGRWHMSLVSGEDRTRIEYLLAPPADFSGTQSFPAGTPNAIHFKALGQVAMHSDLSQLSRTSVYFKSSPAPYGAYNHSHADQNSFVINAGGQRLAIESGYYDNYKTNHWYNWYHQTKAKNAITVDGGLGQVFYEKDNKMGYGSISKFFNSDKFDVVRGDATSAYNGLLSKAKRSMIYLRPNLVVVHDDLASSIARTLEWNIHSLNQMTVLSQTQIQITNGNQTLCVKVLASPDLSFSQTNAFSAAPITGANQWHGKFATNSKITSGEILTLLDVGCTNPATNVSGGNGNWTIGIGQTTINLSETNITVDGVSTDPTAEPPPPPPQPPEPTPSGPYGGTVPTLPGVLEVEKFDLGGEGIGFHDSTLGNSGGAFRTQEDVDIISSTDTAGGDYVVNNFTNGEWLAFTVQVPTTGYFNFQIRYANNYTAPGSVHFELDGKVITPSLALPITGSWSTFQDVTSGVIQITSGTHVLKLVADQQYVNVNQVKVNSAPAPMPPQLNGSVITDASSYYRGSTVTITTLAKLDTQPAIGASVALKITDSAGRVTTLTGTTDSLGKLINKFIIRKNATKGTYKVQSTVTINGQTKTVSTQFLVL